MPLQIDTFVLGPLQNNTYLISDPDTHQAVLVDPAFDSQTLLRSIRQRGFQLCAIWITHAHFDHIAGVQEVANAFQPTLPVSLHPDDLALWKHGGGAKSVGFQFESGPLPSVSLTHGQQLQIGEQTLEVRHTPGHTPGHVIFYASREGFAVVGDLIFRQGVGRTDLAGGDEDALWRSIHEQIFTLPLNTRLLPGHGPETTVQEEIGYY